MSDSNDTPHNLRRRRFLTSAALVAASAPASPSAFALPAAASALKPAETEAFYGKYQAGIATPMQQQSYFMSFDLLTAKRDDVIALLQA